MVTYRIKLRQFRIEVDVPENIRGVKEVAHYITDQLAREYARKLSKDEETRHKLYRNYYDSHIDVIIQLLLDWARKVRG